MTDVALRPEAGLTRTEQPDAGTPVETTGPTPGAVEGERDIVVTDGPTTTRAAEPNGPAPTDPNQVRQADGDGGFLDGFGGAFAKAAELISHPYAQAGLGIAPAVATLMGAPVVGQILSGFMAIFTLGRVFGAIFPPEGSELHGKPLGERLGAALPDLAMAFGWGLGAALPGAGVIGPIMAGLFGMYRGEREVAARQAQERRDALQQEAAAATGDEETAPAQLPPQVSEATSQVPDNLEEAFDDAQRAQSVVAALQTIEAALQEAQQNQALTQALQAEQTRILQALNVAGGSVNQRRLTGEAAPNAEALALLRPLLPPELQRAFEQPAREVGDTP